MWNELRETKAWLTSKASLEIHGDASCGLTHGMTMSTPTCIILFNLFINSVKKICYSFLFPMDEGHEIQISGVNVLSPLNCHMVGSVMSPRLPPWWQILCTPSLIHHLLFVVIMLSVWKLFVFHLLSFKLLLKATKNLLFTVEILTSVWRTSQEIL